MTTLDPSSRSWIVVFNEGPYAMRIVAVEPAPQDPGAFAGLHSDLYVACLSSYQVEATTTEGARRCARQLHDVERIRIVCAHQRACRAQRLSAPAVRRVDQVIAVATEVLTGAAQDLDLTGRGIRYADAMATSALRAGYQHRPWRQRELTFEQYVGQLTLTTAATLFRYAALAAAGRNDEAVALLVNALAATSSDL
ncbi:hypothetical protein [Streptomyces rhizosphaerihabitans]|uniref:hypothetical protein n=1 Tax=Streptomyces rhizosphaerihabitans TaxID=1266770 RepID=UPI0021BE6E34|nr:hypothetical protein [Streptomyces rhizosphaerihabitans]MCT9003498.1 hypothetical protein [Streptomyces rhizosphaerihabitans]